MSLRISDRNKMVLWPGCGGRDEFNLHTKSVRSVWFVAKKRGCCCNLSGGIAFIVWFTMNGMCVKNNTIIYVAGASNNKRDCNAGSLLLLAAVLRSFAHMLLRISDRNKMVLWSRCGGRDEFSLHTKNVRPVWFVVQRRGCCCNLSGGAALIMWFTMNGMCVKKNTIHICGANKQL